MPRLTDEQVQDIRDGLARGLRGPILIKWLEQVLVDRDELLREIGVARQGQAGPQRRSP